MAADLDRRNRYFDDLFARKGLAWLGQNTNHLPMHPAVKQALRDAVEAEEFHAYAPPAGFEALRQAIREDLGLPGASVLVTDGAVAGLFLACRSLVGPGDRVVTTDPGWPWPVRFCRAAGAEVAEIPVYDPEAGCRLTPARLEQAVDRRTRLVYLVDPHNPLGVRYDAAEVDAFCAIARRAGAYLIHDCTYRDFADGHTLAWPLYPERTLVTYSFSKWLGLAGLRVGALVASPDLIARLAAAPPNILGGSVLAQRAALAGLRVKAEWLPGVRAVQRRNQAAVRAAADAVPGLRLPVYPSHGNFVTVDVTGAAITPEALVDAYRERGILIRQGAYHSAVFGHRFVKVSTSVPEEWIDAFCDELAAAVAAARTRGPAGPLF